MQDARADLLENVGPSVNFSVRSTLVGLSLGSLMCFSNMYFGLQTGWISMMSLQASLLGFAIFKPFQDKLSTPFGPKENVYLQTVAVATATMPLAAGFVGIIPALSQLTSSDYPSGPIILPAWKLMLWSLGLSFIGVFFAIPLRKQVIIKEQLKFPSGTATAQMITILHNLPTTTTTTTEEEEEQQLRRRINQFHRQEGDVGGDYWEAHELSIISEETEEEEEEEEEQVDEFPVIATPDLPAVSLDVVGEEISHQNAWNLKLKALLVSFLLSSAYTLASYFFPIIYALPVFNWMTLNYVDFKSWEWYFTPSLSYIGQGIIMGLPTTLSMLFGCIVGWGILSPIAHIAGWAPGPISDWKTGSKGWILWISLGVMISESIVSLLVVLIKQIFVMRRSRKGADINENTVDQQEELLGDESREIDRDDGWEDGVDVDNQMTALQKKHTDLPEDQQVPMYITALGLIASTALCVAMVPIVFGQQAMPIWMTLLSIVFALFLSILGVRALGETDLNPVSGIGKISQILGAGLMPGAIVANLIMGGIAEAGAQQAGDLMQDLKTGYLLEASPKAQFYGQIIGSLVSSFVATGAYLLYTTAYTIPGPEFPAPTAQVWLDMSRLVNGHKLPPHVIEFIIGFSLFFGVLTFLKETGESSNKGWRAMIPQGIAFAIGIYNPPNFTLARVIGGFIASAWENYCEAVIVYSDGEEGTGKMDRWCKPYKNIGKVFIVIVASGFVLGEGTFAIVNMILHAFRARLF